MLWLEQVLRLTRAASAAAVDTLHDPSLLQFVLRHTADAVGGKVGITGLKMCSLKILAFWSKSVLCSVGHLDATKAAQILITLLLPFGNQIGIGNLLLNNVQVICLTLLQRETLSATDLDTIVVQLPRDGFPPVVQIKQISG